MGQSFEGVAHPKQILAPVCGGRLRVAVRPWTMAQADELKPLVIALVERLQALPAGGDGISMARMIAAADEEVTAIVRASVARSLSDADLRWEDLDWEDVFILGQAVWETSVVRPDGGGVAGKLMAVAQALMGMAASAPAVSNPPSPTPSSKNGKPEGSPSSPGAGEPTPSLSAIG